METEVWFAIDHRTSECGYVAAASLLQNRPEGSHTKIRIAFVQGEDAPADWWRGKLSKKFGTNFSIKQIPVELRDFLGAKKIFDSMATYLRIAIPLYAESEKIIYSDADVVFQEDVSKLELSFSGEVAAMVQEGVVGDRWGKEKHILSEHGKKPSDPYFNAGILVIEKQSFIENDVYKKSVQLIANHSTYLAVYDQTVLNCILPNPKAIESRWNFSAFPQTGKTRVDCSKQHVVHFVGSPKPWDLFGEFRHPYSREWIRAARNAGLSFPRLGKYFQPGSWRRAWRIRKQYAVWSPLR